MLIPRRTRIERAGIVLSIASLLGVVIGTVAVAPDTVVGVHIKPPIIFNQDPGAQHRACIKSVTAQQAKSPQGVGTYDSISRFSNIPPDVLCDEAENGVNGFRTLSASSQSTSGGMLLKRLIESYVPTPCGDF